MAVTGGLTAITIPNSLTRPAATQYLNNNFLTNNNLRVTANGNTVYVDSNITQPATGQAYGGIFTPANGPFDFTGGNRKYLYLRSEFARAAANITDDRGFFLCAGPASGGDDIDAACWPMGGGTNDSFDALSYRGIVNPNKTDTASDVEAGYSAANVAKIGLSLREITNTAHRMLFARLYTIDPYVLTGGTVGTPLTFADFYNASYTQDKILGPIFFGSDTNYAVQACCYIGDGTTETHFKMVGVALGFPRGYDNTDYAYGQNHINDGDLGIRANLSAASDALIEDCTIIAGVGIFFELQGSGATTIVNSFLQNASDFELNDASSIAGSTLDACGTIIANAPTITNTAITNATGTALELTDSDNMADVVISGATVGLKFTNTGSATVTLDNFTFSGNTYDIEYTGSGTLTVQPTNGTTVGATNATGGGTISISSSPVTLTVTVLDHTGAAITDGSARVYVKAGAGGPLAEGTEIINSVTNGSGEASDTANYSGGQPIVGWVRKSSGSPYYKQGNILGTIDPNNGLDLAVKLVLDE